MAENNQNSRMANYHRNKKPRKRLWVQIIKWLFIAVLVVIVGGVGLFAYYAKDAPSISQNELQSGGTSSLYTNDGKFLLSLGSEKRNYVTDKEIPQQLKDAIISVEDRRFYKEGLGLDPIRIVGSVLINARSNSVAAGGSTITQQLVKLSVFSTSASQRTLRRKAQEAWLSMKVEREFSKDQILEFYINKVFMNYGNYGMGTAAQYYYGKSLKQLDLAQTALLAGMPNAPVKYNPYLYPEAAKYRRDIVLKTMLSNKKITKAQYNQAVNEPITQGLVAQKNNIESNLRKVDDPYIKEVINEVKQKGFNPYTDNLKITVNIDQDAQQHLYDLANNGEVPFTNDKMQVGATIVDPTNGHVIAIIGGRKLPAVQLGLNRAVQTGRSTGSSIKPVLDFAPAVEYLNWGTSHMLDDTKYIYPGTNIQLYDWDNTYMGRITMRKALEQSRNVPAVRTLSKVGLNRAALFARKMGINVGSDAGLSVAIGANASSLQMAGAYGAFANNGVYHKPQFVSKIETADGLTHNYDSSGTKVMKHSTAYIMTNMLKDVLTKGSGTAAKISGLHEAGKTGSVKYSDEDLVKFPQYANTPKDSWFVGYTKAYSIGIWTGYDNLKDGTISGSGEQSAQILYKQMMSYLMKNKENKDWKKPSTVVKRRIVNGTARRVASPTSHNFTWQLFVKGHAPANPYHETKDNNDDDEEIDSHFDTDSSDRTTTTIESSNESGSTSKSHNEDSDKNSNTDNKDNNSSQDSNSKPADNAQNNSSQSNNTSSTTNNSNNQTNTNQSNSNQGAANNANNNH